MRYLREKTLLASLRESREASGEIGAWTRLLRPSQWIKNFFVLAALLFSGQATQMPKVRAALGAFAAFCLLSSCVYIFNDIVDRKADRTHPTKRNRPIAAGLIAVGPATGLGIGLAVAGLAGAYLVAPAVALGGAAYLALNVLYMAWLKRVVLLDVFSLAAFFLLRLLVGAAAVTVTPSIWLVLCGSLIALYLGFAKRRHELTLLGSDSTEHREVLAHYSEVFLDQMSVVLLAVTIVAYIMYTVFSETALAIGSSTLVYSTIFVLYGVFRYLYLVHQRDGGSPTETLLTDPAIMINGMLWLAYCSWAIYRPL